jgi:ATP-dependent exoDNAse (exonuclease V) beta subunit
VIPAWSYSSIKTFDSCPKKYYHLRIKKDFKDADSTATIYGKELHKAAEDFIALGTPIPPRFSFISETLAALKKIEGEKHCEIKLGIAKRDGKFAPCDFFAKDVWWRGIADLLVVNEETNTAYLVDYKTSKNAKYADTKQLDLLAGAVFKHFPKIYTIKSALLFVVSNEIVKKEHEYMMQTSYLNTMEPELVRLEAALKHDVWNPVSGPLCKFCPVTSCSHNRKG